MIVAEKKTRSWRNFGATTQGLPEDKLASSRGSKIDGIIM
jgi:hypothetical protein